jgi:hypothetical protein
MGNTGGVHPFGRKNAIGYCNSTTSTAGSVVTTVHRFTKSNDTNPPPSAKLAIVSLELGSSTQLHIHTQKGPTESMEFIYSTHSTSLRTASILRRFPPLDTHHVLQPRLNKFNLFVVPSRNPYAA